jgi:hypothetical protein
MLPDSVTTLGQVYKDLQSTLVQSIIFIKQLLFSLIYGNYITSKYYLAFLHHIFSVLLEYDSTHKTRI